jgi:hypothetical protein
VPREPIANRSGIPSAARDAIEKRDDRDELNSIVREVLIALLSVRICHRCVMTAAEQAKYQRDLRDNLRHATTIGPNSAAESGQTMHVGCKTVARAPARAGAGQLPLAYFH